jgi:hypothetical protein
VFEVREDSPPAQITEGTAYCFGSTVATTSAWVGTQHGLLSLTLDGASWRVTAYETDLCVRRVIETGPNSVWVAGHVAGSRWRAARLDPFGAGPTFDVYDESRGVPRDELSLATWGDELLLGSSGSLLRFDRSIDRFTPFAALEPAAAALGPGAADITRDLTGALWFQSGEQQIGRARFDGAAWIVDEPVRRAHLDNSLCFCPDADGLDVKEIHGYEPAYGLRVFRQDVLDQRTRAERPATEKTSA